MKHNSGDACCTKTFMSLFNILFFIIGAAILGFALYNWFGSNLNWYTIPNEFLIVSMAFGGFVILVALTGFCGLTSRGCVFIYTLLLMILLAGQITLAVFVYYGSVNPYDRLDQAWGSMSDQQRLLIQDKAQCCGFNNASDRAAASDTCPSASLGGCYDATVKFYTTWAYYVYIFLFALGAVELIAFFWSVLMLCGCCGIYKKRSDEEYMESNYY